MGPRVAEGGKVLDEGDLHAGAGEKHTAVPGKRGLLLEVENAGVGREAAVVKGDGDGEGGGAETEADKVVRGKGGAGSGCGRGGVTEGGGEEWGFGGVSMWIR